MRSDFHWFYSLGQAPTVRATADGDDFTTFNDIKAQDPQKWIEFSRFDADRLEDAFRKKSCDPIPVLEDYLFTASLATMTLEPYYWSGKVRQIRRSCWFYPGNGGVGFVPVSDGLNAVLERRCAQDERARQFFKRQREAWKEEAKKKRNQGSSSSNPVSPGISPNTNNSDSGEYNNNLTPLDDEHVNFVLELKEKPFDKFNLVFGTNESVWLCDTSVTTRLANSLFSIMNVNFNRGQRLIRGYWSISHLTKDPGPDGPHVAETLMHEDEKSKLDPTFGEQVSFNHLILVIHGMGQKHADNSGNPARSIVHKCKKLRRLLKTEISSNQSDVRPLILPVAWRSNLDLSVGESDLNSVLEKEEEGKGDKKREFRAEGLDSFLKAVTLPSVPFVRNFISDVILDVIMYMNNRFSNKILDLNLTLMNDMYDRVMRRHPDFQGKVSLFCHSLGSVIAFDILKEDGRNSSQGQLWKKLNFQGSPISVFLGLEGLKLHGCTGRVSASSASVLPSTVRLHCTNFFNIFHPDDPVSYRLEPAICRFRFPKEPRLVHSSKGSMGSIQISNLINSLRMRFQTATMTTVASSPQTSDNEEDESLDDDDEEGEEDCVSPNTIKRPTTPLNTPEEATAPPPLPPRNIDPWDTESWLRLYFNNLGRVDFCLHQPQISLTPSVLNSMSAHMIYWNDVDVMAFIHSQLMSEIKEKT